MSAVSSSVEIEKVTSKIVDEVDIDMGIEIESSDSGSSAGGGPALSASVWDQVLKIKQEETAFSPRSYSPQS